MGRLPEIVRNSEAKAEVNSGVDNGIEDLVQEET